ncbi:GNAT family N-acetyltransferase [Hippea maritima]|uniref:Pseudaminic acid biosynthesis N-acetyl transferase n=1 Tax=Hippea maritima (strain ATCC 700847 / DSM 10411 / MH2) TaxID=760142 RepID=F2LUK4_HIPMA|nr:GNAT family N-acetyltransferase [Hippea maritima]AEA34594.1 hypothetical protein Hipma_1644 [Hippea maritima DSM 10411]
MNLTLKNFVNLTLEEQIEVLKIRNAKYVRTKMKNSNIIKLTDHLNWINSLSQDKNKRYYAVFLNNEIIGANYVLLLNKIIGYGNIGFYFKQNTPPIISSISIVYFLEMIFNNLNINKIFSEVKTNNSMAYRFSKSLGFKVVNIKVENDEKYYLMELNRQKWERMKDTKLLKSVKKQSKDIVIKFEED